MRKETITREIYTFDELSQESKEYAVSQYIKSANCTFFDDQEIYKSYEQATTLIYDKLETLRDDTLYFDINNINTEFYGVRLYTWILNNLSYIWENKKVYYTYDRNKIVASDWIHKFNDNAPKKLSYLKTINNIANCPLTGVCWDFDSMNTIIEFMECPDNTTTIDDLLNHRNSLEDIVNNNYEFRTSFECIAEELSNNDSEFYKNGEMI